MKPVLTAAEYRRVDQAYEGDLTLAMERAGHAVALAAARRGSGYGKRVIVLAGPGNNGGDGYVAARHLRRRGAAVVVHRYGKPKTPEATQAAARASTSGVPFVDISEPEPCDLVIDALFGGGVRGGLPDAVAAWTLTRCPVVAVDFPTGLDPDTGEAADHVFTAIETVTFSTLKTGHVSGAGPDLCGEVTVADIGIHGGRPSLYVAEERDSLRPPRPRRSHKWSAGSVLVAGGSRGMTGAAVLAARGALAFGAGSVYLATVDPDAAHLMAPEVPALDLGEAARRVDRFDVVVVGPGLQDADRSAATPLVEKAGRVVLDAGALVPEMVSAATRAAAEVVATPHAGEFQRIAGVGLGRFSVRSYAQRAGVIVIAKGNPTIVTDGMLPILVTTGTQALATIGTGDVLAGMVAALWARGLEPTKAAVSAAYWHGVAGRSLASSGTLTASRLAEGVGAWAW